MQALTLADILSKYHIEVEILHQEDLVRTYIPLQQFKQNLPNYSDEYLNKISFKFTRNETASDLDTIFNTHFVSLSGFKDLTNWDVLCYVHRLLYWIPKPIYEQWPHPDYQYLVQ